MADKQAPIYRAMVRNGIWIACEMRRNDQGTLNVLREFSTHATQAEAHDALDAIKAKRAKATA